MKSKIIAFLKERLGDRPAVLGLSGGIDSAVVAYLLVEAIGSESVHVMILPSSTNTTEDLNQARALAEKLKIKVTEIPIDGIEKAYMEVTDNFNSSYTLGNLKSRIRMNLLYGKANELEALVVGTGNKSELMVGYFTKYGDGGVDLLPIGNLYKYQVRALASALGVPAEIISKTPTAGLVEGQADEDELGMTYIEMDEILECLDSGKSLSKFDDKLVQLVRQMKIKSEHKRMMPPIAQI